MNRQMHIPQLIAPGVQGLILSSNRLREALAPEDPAATPYEILDYQGVLTLHDERGAKATFRRRQKVRFAQEDVSAILDHMWGTGVIIADYHNTAGKIGDSFRAGAARHLVIDMGRRMRRGEEMTFDVERVAMCGFGYESCWLETAIDHPVRRLTQTIIFPKDRPCQVALLDLGESQLELRVIVRADGRTQVRFEIPGPDVEPLYLVRWLW